MGNNYVEISQIDVDVNRQRKEFEPIALQELSNSIQARGLINAINIEPVRETGRWKLIAGERRLRVIKDLHELGITFQYDNSQVPIDMVPFTIFSQLSPLDRALIEFEENNNREALTWQEHAKAVARIVELTELQAEIYEETATISDVIKNIEKVGLHISPRIVNENIILARNMHNSLVNEAKSRGDAYKALRKEETAKRYVEEAVRVGTTLRTADYQVNNMDCLDWMTTYQGPLFDVIVTDPPYGMGADTFGDSGKEVMGEHCYEDSVDTVMKLLLELPEHLYTLTKPDAHLYLFCDIDQFHNWKTNLAAAGWDVFRTPIIWYKPAAFRAPWPEHGPQRKYETIVYAKKGDRKYNYICSDVIECRSDENLGNKAQKPVSLFHDLLSRSIRPGDLVFDPFCGTGPIFEAAHRLSCKAVGVELNPISYGISLNRIQGLIKGEL